MELVDEVSLGDEREAVFTRRANTMDWFRIPLLQRERKRESFGVEEEKANME